MIHFGPKNIKLSYKSKINSRNRGEGFTIQYNGNLEAVFTTINF